MQADAFTLKHSKTFPVRFGRKFGNVSADAKRGESAQVYRNCDADS